MSDFNHVIMGRLVDPSLTDISQETLNAESLFINDKQVLLNLVKEKTTKQDLNFYFDILQDCPNDYWFLLLDEIIKYYSLNSINIIINDISLSNNLDIQKAVKNLFYFLKNYQFEKITKDFLKSKKEDLTNYTFYLKTLKEKSIEIPYLFNWFLTYTDSQSFLDFLKTMKFESKKINSFED